jgi:hypothetical protein
LFFFLCFSKLVFFLSRKIYLNTFLDVTYNNLLIHMLMRTHDTLINVKMRKATMENLLENNFNVNWKLCLGMVMLFGYNTQKAIQSESHLKFTWVGIRDQSYRTSSLSTQVFGIKILFAFLSGYQIKLEQVIDSDLDIIRYRSITAIYK